MSTELDALVEQLTPHQRAIYDAIGRGERIYWQHGRKGGKFVLRKALELRAEEEKSDADR